MVLQEEATIDELGQLLINVCRVCLEPLLFALQSVRISLATPEKLKTTIRCIMHV